MAGRPPGSKESPEDLSRKELLRGLKLYRDIIDDIEKEYASHKDGMNLAQKMEVAEFLRRSNLDFIRLWIAPAKAADAGSKERESEEDPSKILAQLLEGSKRQ